MAGADSLKEGQVLTGPLFNEPMRVETVQANGPSSWVVGLVGTQSERFRKVTLSSADVERLTVIDAHPSYDGDGRLLRLGSPEPRSGASCSTCVSMTAPAWPTPKSWATSRASRSPAFCARAVAWFARRGIVAQRVLSDNGSAYRSRLVAAVCQALELGHRFTRPYTPRTNGKAERFIQTLLREWAYAVAYPSSAHRTAALDRWLHYYNWHRPHTALNRQPPISRVVGRDDLLRLHS